LVKRTSGFVLWVIEDNDIGFIIEAISEKSPHTHTE
jgi:hypothetical protein